MVPMAEDIQSVASSSANDKYRAMRLRQQRDEARKELEKLRTEHAELLSRHKSTTTERDNLKQKLEAAPGELQQQIEKLQGELTKRDNSQTLSKLYEDKELGLSDKVTPERLAKLLDLDLSKPLEAEKVGELVRGLRESDPYLFAPADEKSASSRSGDPANPSGGVQRLAVHHDTGRGSSDRDTGRFVVSRSKLADGLSSQEQKDYAAAAKNGTLVVTD